MKPKGYPLMKPMVESATHLNLQNTLFLFRKRYKFSWKHYKYIMIMQGIIDRYKFMYLVETPLLGIYFIFFSVKMGILEGKANAVLKLYA